MRFLLFLLILISTHCEILSEMVKFVHNHQILYEKGLIFTEKKNLFFTSGNWELHTKIAVDDIFNAAPTMEKLDLEMVRLHCVGINKGWKSKMPKDCGANLRMEDFRMKIQRVEELTKKLATYTFLSREKPKNATITESDLKKERQVLFHYTDLQERFPELQLGTHKYKESMSLYGNQNKYSVKSGIMNDFALYLERMTGGVMLRENFLKSSGKTDIDNYLFTQMTFDFLSGTDMYISLINQLLMGLDSADSGKLHRSIIPPTYLQAAAAQWEKFYNTSSVKLVVDAENLNSSTLTQVSSLQYHYSRGDLVFKITVPILKMEEFHLYQLISYPVLQRIGKSSREVMVYIQPRADYLVISPGHNYYGYFSSQDLSACISTNEYPYICPASMNNFLQYPHHRSCEMNIYDNRKHEIIINPFYDCDLRVIKEPYSYYRNIGNKGVWLYALPRTEKFSIFCNNDDGEYHAVMNLTGSGILSLDEGCFAESSTIKLDGAVGFSTIEDGASRSLNLLWVFSDLSNYNVTEDSMPPSKSWTGRFPNHYLLQYDFTLTELVDKLRKQHQMTIFKENVEIIETYVLILALFVCLISLYELFPETVTAIILWLRYVFCRCTMVGRGRKYTTEKKTCVSISPPQDFRRLTPSGEPVNEPPQQLEITIPEVEANTTEPNQVEKAVQVKSDSPIYAGRQLQALLHPREWHRHSSTSTYVEMLPMLPPLVSHKTIPDLTTISGINLSSSSSDDDENE